MKREDYKAIKHMDKRTLDEYLMNIFAQGYRAGIKAMTNELKKQQRSAGEHSS